MVILDEGVKSGLAAARTNRENGKFAPEGHKALEDELHLGKFGFSPRDVVCGPQNPLALAVIAHSGRLEDSGQAELLDGGVKLAHLRDRQKFGSVDRELA